MPNSTSEARVKTHARELGFDAVGIARVDPDWSAGDFLRRFVEAGLHGEMTWMADTLARRRHPGAMWPADKAAISVYARGADYHDVLKKRLKQLARQFAETSGHAVKVFVDTAPLMEKPLAALAGLGWQGKHTNLVSRELGSWTFLGVMLTDAELVPDEAESDHCGSCRACLDICPTGAFPAPYRLDARRCISYLTIELKGPIPREFRAAMGNRIYGCDDCLAVCPWNKFAETARESAFHARVELDAPALDALVQLDDTAFREVFAGSPVKRIGRERFVRNGLIAIGNSGQTGFLRDVVDRLSDDSALVRGAAVWALSRLDSARFLSEKAARQNGEIDPDVRDEWDHAGTG